jgi:hypothetical protein
MKFGVLEIVITIVIAVAVVALVFRIPPVRRIVTGV